MEEYAYTDMWAGPPDYNGIYDVDDSVTGLIRTSGPVITVYTAEHGALVEYKPVFQMRDHFQNEIDAFIDCIKSGKKLPSHIDTVVITAQMMQAIYDSADQHREIVLD